jgi:nicotinamidase-related amidase
VPAKNRDLHGNAPDNSDMAFILIDVINDLAFDDGKKLLKHAVPMAKRIATLKARAKQAGIPSIYVDDNFGRWQSDFQKLIEHCLMDDVCGKSLASSR